jgi:3',5'-nucleoside bisphosphate phosphatase
MTTPTRRSLISLIVLLLAAFVPAWGQEIRHEIHFPDLPGLITLKCDLHMHTVFSDGQVWPTVRVTEAWRQGFDAISITDHIEYQPFKDDIPTNHERPYQLAKGGADARGLILIKGTEITRDTPPGHFNAIFLDDINPLDTPEFLDAIERSNQQGAFVFWNHQAWQGEEKGSWMDVHTTMFENKWFHGMEVCNGGSYYPTAHRWCLEKNLTMLGTSDIHAPDLRLRSAPDDHRTITLIFARERTAESIKEALFAGRTVVWFQDQLIGKQEHLEPLFHAAVRIELPIIRSGKTAWLRVRNAWDVDVQLTRTGDVGPGSIKLPARATTLVRVTTAEPDSPLDLRYVATNLLIAPETGLPVVLKVEGSD